MGDSDKMAASVLHRSGKGRPAERGDLVLVLSTGSGVSANSPVMKG